MPVDQDYREGLSAGELVGALQSLFAAERTAMRIICRYLAGLADRMQAGRTECYAAGRYARNANPA